jgi:hypothetical protein
MNQATLFLVASSAALAALTTLGLALERSWYWIHNQEAVLPTEEAHAIVSAIDVPVVYATLWLEFGTWMTAGMLLAAGFRRLNVVGLLLTTPLAVTMIVLTEDGLGVAGYLGPSLQWQDIAVWFSVPGVLLGLAASWSLTRKIAI